MTTEYTEYTFAGPLLYQGPKIGRTYYSTAISEHDDRGKQRRALTELAADVGAEVISFDMHGRQHVRMLCDTHDYPWVTLATILRDHWPFVDLAPIDGGASAALVALVEYLDGTGERTRVYVCDRWRARRRWNDLPPAFRQHVWDLALRGDLARHLPTLD